MQDFSSVLTAIPDLEPAKLDEKRNPHRSFNIETKHKGKDTRSSTHNSEGIDAMDKQKQTKTIMNEGDMIQIAFIRAHETDIKSICYIKAADVPMILTASLDKTVRLFQLCKKSHGIKIVLKGKLMQGYLALPKYHWDFPL